MFEQDILSGGPLQGLGLYGVALVLFTILTWVGLGYLTQMAFNKNCTMSLTENQVNMTKLAALLLWATLVFNVVGITVQFKSKLFAIVALVLSVISLVGVAYMISFAWDNKCTASLTANETMLAKFSSLMVLLTVVMHVFSSGKQMSDSIRGDIALGFM